MDKSDQERLMSLLRSGRREEAEKVCREICNHFPGDADAWLMLAAIYSQLGILDQVVECCQRTLDLRPNDLSACYNLGVALQQLERFEEAASAFQSALHLHPEHLPALTSLGGVLREMGSLDEAEVNCRHVLNIDSDNPQALNVLGLVYLDRGSPASATPFFHLAITHQPNMASAHYNLGLCYIQLNQPNDAEQCFHEALRLKPGYVDARADLGVALMAQGRVEEAIASYKDAINLAPHNAATHLNLANALLLSGDFEHGWTEYEWRWKRKINTPGQVPCPPWDGGTLKGKTILLHAEQGMGDTLQFIRYAEMVKQSGGTVLVECQPELIRLLETCSGIDRLIVRGDRLPRFDVHLPLLSLPGIFGTDHASIPAHIPYLHAPAANKNTIAALGTLGNSRKVGIVWAGSPQHGNDRNRSCSLDYFCELEKIPELSLVSLQKGERVSDLRSNAGTTILDLDPFLADFAETAAVLDVLDLVITVDTSIAHLAGAMGRQVWLLLPFAPDWRWRRDIEFSPWYPTMRLFRQPGTGDWGGVFLQVTQALSCLPDRQENSPAQ